MTLWATEADPAPTQPPPSPHPALTPELGSVNSPHPALTPELGSEPASLVSLAVHRAVCFCLSVSFVPGLCGYICVALVCFRPLGLKDGCLWSIDPLSITQRTGPFKTTRITLMFAPCSCMPAVGLCLWSNMVSFTHM